MVEYQIVTLKVMGSNPIICPKIIFSYLNFLKIITYNFNIICNKLKNYSYVLCYKKNSYVKNNYF